MNKKILAISILGILYGIPTHADTKFVTLPNGGMVPCDHPLAISAGINCTTRTTVVDYKCDGDINPYLEPDRAAFCSIKNPQPGPSRPFRIGEKYYHPYGDKMVVIAIIRDIGNNEVVIFQIYEGPKLGVMYTFINVVNHNLQKVE